MGEPEHTDVVVIGLGPGGEYAAGTLAEAGLPGLAGTSEVTPDWAPVARRMGLTEERARAAGLRVSTGITQIPSFARGWIHKAGNDGFIKVVADASRSVLVGASSAGPCGGEVLSALHRAIEDALTEAGTA